MQTSTERRSLSVLMVLAVITGCAFWILNLSDNKVFTPYFAGIHPLAAVFVVSISGIISLYILNVRGYFQIFQRKNLIPGVLYSLSITPIFALFAISLDLIYGFPEEINVLFPASSLFYPGIAYIVELAFHAIPLTVLLLITDIFSGSKRSRLQIYSGIFIVSLIEPAYQFDFLSSESSGLVFQSLLMIHLFLFNLVQMYIFRRFDFLSMYLFRVLFYLQWHIVWGELRLVILF